MRPLPPLRPLLPLLRLSPCYLDDAKRNTQKRKKESTQQTPRYSSDRYGHRRTAIEDTDCENTKAKRRKYKHAIPLLSRKPRFPFGNFTPTRHICIRIYTCVQYVHIAVQAWNATKYDTPWCLLFRTERTERTEGDYTRCIPLWPTENFHLLS